MCVCVVVEVCMFRKRYLNATRERASAAKRNESSTSEARRGRRPHEMQEDKRMIGLAGWAGWLGWAVWLAKIKRIKKHNASEKGVRKNAYTR